MEAVAGEFQPQVGATAATGVAEGWSRLGTLHAGLVSTLARLLAGKLRDEGQAELATATASTTVALIFLLLLPSALPTRHKAAGTAAAVAGRLMFWALPGMRGSILSALEGPSRPGAAGVLHVLLGTRCLVLLGHAVASSAIEPLPTTLDLTLLLFALTRAYQPAAMCAAPMLSHPAWQQRLASWHDAVAVVLPGQALVVRAGGSAALLEGPEAQCHHFVAAAQLFLGVVLPLLVSFATQAPPPMWWAFERRATLRRLAEEQQGKAAGPVRRALATVHAAWRCGYVAVEARLQHACRALLSGNSVQELAVTWLLLLAGIHLAAWLMTLLSAALP